jgi:hypothetical protein
MRAGWLSVASLAAVAALAAGGCTKILGLDYTYQGTGTGGGTTTGATGTTGTTGTGGASACGSFVWDPSSGCQGCMEKSCCAELRACDTGTPCALVAACGRPCKPGDDACLTACINEDSNKHNGSGIAAYDALVNCFGKNCDVTTQCSFPVCNSNYFWSSRACADCLGSDAGCCATFTACNNDPVCSVCMQNPMAAMGCSANMNFQKAYACATVTCGLTCTYLVCSSPAFGYYAADCNYCVSKTPGGCCMQFNACLMDTTCYQCMLGSTMAACNTDMLFNTYQSCATANCSVECAGF